MRTSAIMPSTVLLSWLQALKRCTNVIDSSCWSDRRLTATVMCRGSPRLANQSLWLSLYFLGRNFMAQSWTKKTEFSSNLSNHIDPGLILVDCAKKMSFSGINVMPSLFSVELQPVKLFTCCCNKQKSVFYFTNASLC